MYIEKLKLKNYRNYNEIEIDFDKNINIIYGNNAFSILQQKLCNVKDIL